MAVGRRTTREGRRETGDGRRETGDGRRRREAGGETVYSGASDGCRSESVAPDVDGMAAGGYRDLRAWQRAMELTVACYRCTRQLPTEERLELSRQIRRASASIAANIAEGNARSHHGDYLHFLSIARGSTAELMTHLELVERL